MARSSLIATCAIAYALIAFSAAQASSPSALENSLPKNTKGVVLFPNIDQAIERWNETQLGQLMKQPAMKPFVDELSEAFQGDFLKLGERLGVQIGQLRELRGGEVALALVQPNAGGHAAVLVVDVRGREAEANQLIAEIATDVENRGGSRSAVEAAGVVLTSLKLPGQTEQRAYYAVRKGHLVLTDQLSVAGDVVQLIDGGAGALSESRAFQRIAKVAALEQADVRWFVEPFGLVEVLRAANPDLKKQSPDLFKVLSNQGFRAIEGVGGQIRLATESHDILHRTQIYAPGNSEGERFELAARMLSFPNSNQMDPLNWIPADVTSHISMRWNLRDAFEYSKTIVNEYAGEQVFDEILENIEKDENGPQINIRRELVAHLANRVTVIADNAKPIDADSERIAFAVELTDAKSVLESLDRAMQHDPQALVHQVGDYHIWEMGGAEKEDDEEEIVVMIDNPFGGNPFGPSLGDDPAPEEPAEEEEEEEKLLSNVCFTVANGHLIVSKKLELLRKILKREAGDATLSETPDFVLIEKTLRKLGAGNDSARFFVRTAKAYEPTYEMLRAGRMPESNSLLGRVLNSLAQAKGDKPREQRIDGGTMPAFDEIRGYLRPAGMYTVSTEDGWVLTGCLLAK